MDNNSIEKFQLFENAKVIDLSATFNNDLRGFHARVSVQADGLNAHTYEIYSHAGTHIDAPYRYGVNHQTIDNLELHQLMGRAWVVRLKGIRDRSILRIEHLGEVAKKLEKGDSLLLQTGWSEYLGQPRYRNKLPRVGKELAQWMVKKSVKMLGVEPPSVADVQNMDEAKLIHQILLGGKVVIIEGLKNLDLISSDLVWLIALPIKIENGDGAPARVIAFEI